MVASYPVISPDMLTLIEKESPCDTVAPEIPIELEASATNGMEETSTQQIINNTVECLNIFFMLYLVIE